MLAHFEDPQQRLQLPKDAYAPMPCFQTHTPQGTCKELLYNNRGAWTRGSQGRLPSIYEWLQF
jgi:hypothetical protein